MPEDASGALYGHAQSIVHALLDLPPETRNAGLEQLCGDDAQLRREVEWLIAAATDTSPDEIPPAIAAVAVELSANLHVDAAAPGRYRLIEPLGEGGMGVVWLAERQVGGVRQRVALKRLRADSVAQQTRFRDEQRILATLSHPNIARLVDAGTDADGDPFLAMEYVEGERLDHWCDARGLDLRARISLFLKICAAVSYAHERLIIHRDLKPANILVDGAGEPKLLDFGIARLVGADTTVTQAPRAMTLAYASPEQIEGALLGTATDVWSLGVVLYELVAGVRPFEPGAAGHALANAILSGSVLPPSRQSPRIAAAVAERLRPYRIPADIDAIVLKALRREPVQRYASLREFAQDLECFLAARPVQARRGQRIYPMQRFVQRNRWPLAAGAALLAIVAGFTWRTVQAEREARLQAQLAERTTSFLISAFTLSDPTRAGRHDFSAREVLDRGRDRVDEELAGQPRMRARLLEALGNAYRGINEGTAGAPLLETAAQLYLDPSVADPLAAARSLRAKAIGVLAVRGSTDEAERAAQRAFDLITGHAAGDSLVLADAYGTLAQALAAGGKQSRADGAAQQALALREAGGASPLAIAQSLFDLCAIASNSGEYARALRFCERALALYADAGAKHSDDYRVTLKQFGVTLLYSGNSERGLAVLRERIALTRELFGEDSTALAMDLVFFSEKLAEHGLFDEAAAALAAGTPVILRRNGAQSTQYALAVFNAGWLRYALGEFDAAAKLLREALEIHEDAVDGRDNDRLQVFRVALAMALMETGRADTEARSLLDSVIATRSSADADSLDLAYARLPLAHWLADHGEHAQAAALLDQVDAVGNRVEAELHARAATVRAAVLRARGDFTAALKQEQSAYELTRSDRGARHPRTARYALAYARALRAAGDTQQAQALEREFRTRLESAYPADSAFRRLLPESP